MMIALTLMLPWLAANVALAHRLGYGRAAIDIVRRKLRNFHAPKLRETTSPR